MTEEEFLQAVNVSAGTERPQGGVQLSVSPGHSLPRPVGPAEVGDGPVLGASLSRSETVRAHHDAAGGAGVVQVEERGAADIAHLSHTLVSSPPD